jgi:hypothetical protein
MTPVLKKLMKVQLLKQNKTTFIVFDNDANAYYDRIVSDITLAALRNIGYSKNPVKMMGLLWDCSGKISNTRFALDMVYQTRSSSTAERILYGIGQVSCASPIICALLNQLLVSALDATFK